MGDWSALIDAALFACVAGIALTLRRQAREMRAHLAYFEALAAGLDHANVVRSDVVDLAGPLERLIRTASWMRDQGLARVIQGTIDEVTSWANDRNAGLSTSAPEPTTIMFSDIENSTVLNARVGDRAWLQVLTAHDGVIRRAVAQYDGHVVKTFGDGFMVVFRSATSACGAARMIQNDLQRPLVAARRHARLRVRIGIHTGQVIARDADYFGQNVAIAARVADLAVGGEILLSDAARTALGEDPELRLDPTEPVTLRGLPGEFVLWKIRAA